MCALSLSLTFINTHGSSHSCLHPASYLCSHDTHSVSCSRSHSRMQVFRPHTQTLTDNHIYDALSINSPLTHTLVCTYTQPHTTRLTQKHALSHKHTRVCVHTPVFMISLAMLVHTIMSALDPTSTHIRALSLTHKFTQSHMPPASHTSPHSLMHAFTTLTTHSRMHALTLTHLLKLTHT